MVGAEVVPDRLLMSMVNKRSVKYRIGQSNMVSAAASKSFNSRIHQNETTHVIKYKYALHNISFMYSREYLKRIFI